MSKLSLVLAAFLVAGVANAQVGGAGQAAVNNPPPPGGGAGAGAGAGAGLGLGSITFPTIIAGSIAVGVVAAAGTNAQGDTIPPVPPVDLKCEGTDPLVNGLFVGTRQETQVTVSGTGTGTTTASATRTTTISVPVTFTYAPK
jgi:hypothetical protein